MASTSSVKKHSFRTAREWLSSRMRPLLPPHVVPLRLLAATLAAAAATGLSFALWIDKGPGIFMALVDSGMSWCF